MEVEVVSIGILRRQYSTSYKVGSCENIGYGKAFYFDVNVVSPTLASTRSCPLAGCFLCMCNNLFSYVRVQSSHWR